jgi:membrane protease YdiL (CAAX protease family)
MDHDADRPGPVASAKHTARLAAILLAIALLGYVALIGSDPGRTAGGGGSAGLYFGLLAAEWGLFAYVRLGLRRHGTSVMRLISAEPLTVGRLAADALFGLALLVVLTGAEILLSKLGGAGNKALVNGLLVRDPALVPLWLLLAVSAGIVEEFTFRGYFQRQFGAWLGNPWSGVVVQAILFGVTHGYQGGVLILRITVYGLIFGLAALLRRSLVPGMVAHAGVDIVGGLAAFR